MCLELRLTHRPDVVVHFKPFYTVKVFQVGLAWPDWLAGLSHCPDMHPVFYTGLHVQSPGGALSRVRLITPRSSGLPVD